MSLYRKQRGDTMTKMATPRFHFHYNFHPVGQGLFASGRIYRDLDQSWFFQWVYDCGTSSSQKFVLDELAHLNAFNNGRGRIDLATISHFDHDHISGISE